MRLSALVCGRYRNVKDKQRIDLAPITIIIGKNGSGKSVICRLPLLLSKAISESSDSPLDLFAGGVEHAYSYKDVVHARSALPFVLGAEFKEDDKAFGFETTLRYVDENRSLAVEGFELFFDGVSKFRIELQGVEQLLNERKEYNLYLDGVLVGSGIVDFLGLLPSLDELIESKVGFLRDLFVGFRSALGSPSYLGPFRVEANRFVKMPNQHVTTLGPKGERAVEVLVDDKLRRGGGLVSKVSEWYQRNMGHELTVDTSSEQPRIYLTDMKSSVDIAFSDTGAGFSQSLPIVVQHFAFRNGRIPSPVLIVEQPELHLHPAAHGDLADLAVESVRTDGGAQATCIIETHSEQLVMRIRRRIAEGFPAADVKIWSLDHLDGRGAPDTPQDEHTRSPFHLISFDEAGNPDSWPAGVFEEALRDLTLMRRSARDRGL